jgi:hypothetical protein
MTRVEMNPAGMAQLERAVQAKADELSGVVGQILRDGGDKTIDQVVNEIVTATRFRGFEPNHAEIRSLVEGTRSKSL